jgi:hypothetical protein
MKPGVAMERVLAPVFVVIVICAGLSLDFYSARRANPGLSPQDYVQLRISRVMGPDGADAAAASAVLADASAAPDSAAVASGDGKAPSALGALSLAASVVAGLASHAKPAADAPAQAVPVGTVDPNASPEQMQKQAAAAFAQVAIAIATGNKDAIFPAQGAAAPQAAPAPTPPPAMIQPVKRLATGSCAGTKFCSVGGN